MALRLVVADASVVIKWFHAAGEEAVEPARAILEVFARRQIDLVILDLTIYEIGNILNRRRGEPGSELEGARSARRDMQPVRLRSSERLRAAQLATKHGLTFYDAACAAVALERGGRLVTMDRRLLAAELGDRPEDAFDWMERQAREAWERARGGH